MNYSTEAVLNCLQRLIELVPDRLNRRIEQDRVTIEVEVKSEKFDLMNLRTDYEIENFIIKLMDGLLASIKELGSRAVVKSARLVTAPDTHAFWIECRIIQDSIAIK